MSEQSQANHIKYHTRSTPDRYKDHRNLHPDHIYSKIGIKNTDAFGLFSGRISGSITVDALEVVISHVIEKGWDAVTK